MEKLRKIYIFLERNLKLKNYESKLIFFFFIILLLTNVIFFLIFTFIQTKEELEFSKKGLKNAVKIRSSLFEKRIKILENTLKSTSLDKIKDISYIVGYKRGNVLYNFKRCSEDNLKIHICDKDTIHIKVKKDLDVIVKKEYFKDVLNPKKGMISIYNPIFIIQEKSISPDYGICFYENIPQSNINLWGCINKKEIITSHLLKSLKESFLLGLIFLIVSYLLLKLRIKHIILFPLFYLKKKLDTFNIEKPEEVYFDLHKFIKDEFGSLSESLENMRLNILKHKKEIELILDTTSKMVSFTNDIYKFILFTLNKVEEIFGNIKASVIFVYDKETFKDIIEIHSDGFLSLSIISEEKIKKICLKAKDSKQKEMVIKEKDYYYVVIKKELTEDKELIFIAISENELSDHEKKYINIILMHLIYSINLLNLANFDVLTKLYNRQALTKKLKEETKRAKRYNQIFSILLIDLDDFKNINDTYGHFVGDFILKNVSKLIKDTIREIDIIGRWGGEEFLILLPNANLEEALKIANRIREVVNNHTFEVNGLKIKITLSIGVATFNIHGDTLEELLQAADISLYKVKKTGKNAVIALPKEEVEAVVNLEFSRKSILEEIINQDGILPFFQGIHDINSRKIVGYEVLARIKVDNNILPAGKFIGDFIKFGLIEQLDKKVQLKALSCINMKNIEDKLFFFNLSKSFIHNIENLEKFIKHCENYQIPFENIVFEITEEEAITDINTVREIIRIAKSKNIKFALDDFGAGYSTFSYIKYFDIDFIKIDGSLVKDVSKNKDNQIILEGIIHISKLKGIKTIAEWVENEEDLSTLKELGINYVQGFYLSRPKNLCN